MKPLNKKILVVDDDKKIREALTIRLRTAGYEVLSASNGLSGLEIILSEQPDLLLLDVWMPVGMGFSLVQHLEKVSPKRIPVIFITGSKLDGIRETAWQLNAAAFLEKPYDPQDLLATIASTLKAYGDN